MKIYKKLALTVLPLATTVAMSGCSLMQWNKPIKSTSQNNQSLQLKDQRIKILESNLSARDKSLKAAKAKLAIQQQSTTAPPRYTGSDSLLPPARPGECYAKVLIPAKYETKTKKLLKRAQSEKVEVIPAKYGWEEETIQVADSSYDLVSVPGDFTTKTVKYQTSEGRRYWAVSMKPQAAEANSKLLEAAKNTGINLESAKVGTCYHEHYTPPKYKTVTEQVLATEASTKVHIIPAKYTWEEKKILVKEASEKIVPVPETYKTISEKILVEPAKTVWKKGRGPVEKLDNSTGDIMCLIEVPAVYKTVTKTIVATPATTKTVQIPAEYKTVKVKKLVSEAQEKETPVPPTYKTISKKVLINDGSLAWHEVHDKNMSVKTETGHKICLRETPPTYASYTTKVVKNTPSIKKVDLGPKFKKIKVRKLITPAQTKRIKIPAEYQTIAKKVKVTDEHMQWVPILCETNFNFGLISQLQKKLKAAGYNPGPLDGNYGKETFEAVSAFQKKNGLVSGHLTMETLRALGVAYQ